MSHIFPIDNLPPKKPNKMYEETGGNYNENAAVLTVFYLDLKTNTIVPRQIGYGDSFKPLISDRVNPLSLYDYGDWPWIFFDIY